MSREDSDEWNERAWGVWGLMEYMKEGSGSKGMEERRADQTQNGSPPYAGC